MTKIAWCIPLTLVGFVLVLSRLDSLPSVGPRSRLPNFEAISSRKLMQVDESKENEKDLNENYLYGSEIDDHFGRFAHRQGNPPPPPPPPPPPHPARYEMCQGIPHKRYKFVHTFDQIKKALARAKPGDLIEVKSGVYFQGSGPGKSSLIPPDLDVDERGNVTANQRDPREDRMLVKYIRSETEQSFLEEEAMDEEFATLYELYSEAYLLPLIESDSVSAPAPAPISNKPSDPQNTSSDEGKIKSPESNPPKPGKQKEAPPPAPVKSEVPDVEYENDRYEFDDLEDYTVIEDDSSTSPRPDGKPPGARPGPWIAPSGFIDNVHGTKEDPITLCGPKTAVFDGSNGDRGLAAAALRVIRSSHVVVKGFTLQNALKGLDVQKTNSSTFSNITTRYTLQEGIRLRYNSTFNVVHGCNISYTGRLWVGIGEGMYVGTSTKNSIAAGLPRDHSDFNNITWSYFGEGITAENIDIKEFTSGGFIANNTFNGSSIAGLNGAIAWVAIKGNNYTVVNNTGSGTLRGGQGFRVLQRHKGLAHDNSILNNTCLDFELGSFCVFVDPRANNTKVNCSNKRSSASLAQDLLQVQAFSPTKRVCNCEIDTKCPSTDSNQTTMYIKRLHDGLANGGQVQEQSVTSAFYATGYSVLPRKFIRDLEDLRPMWD